MKKIICIVSALTLMLSALCACAKNDADNAKNKEETTASTTASTTAFTTGSEAATSSAKDGDEKQVFHRDEDGNDLLVEHFDADGKKTHYEEPVYNADGSIGRIKYYDKNKKPVAQSDTHGKFYDKDGREISENDFVILMSKAGILQ